MTEFAMMEPTIQGSSTPTTTLTTGMENLVDREVLQLQPASNSKVVFWAHSKDSTSSVYTSGDFGGLKHDPFVSRAKRKWSVTFDPKESTFQEESDVVLALGRCSDSRNNARVGIPCKDLLRRGTEGTLNLAVRCSELEHCIGCSGGNCREKLDAISLSRISSEQSSASKNFPHHLHREASKGLLKNSASESDLLLSLGNRGHETESREGCNFSGSNLRVLQDEQIVASSKELPLDLGLCVNPNQNNSIGESRSFSGPRGANDCAGAFLGLGPNEHQPESICEPGSQPMLIPIVDEGSSSARWRKSGGLVPSLLKSSQAYQDTQKISALDCSGSNSVLADHHEELVEPDFSISVRPYSGTTSINEVSASRDRAFRICKFRGCVKGARGTSGLCIAHGGGHRCQKHGCNKGAEGRTVYCKAHGGGKRCQTLGCTKSAEGKTDYCIGHGGGRRCSHEGCVKAARGSSGLCIRHGGGKRCKKEGCTKSAEGYTGLCISHGGGRRCQFEGCTKGAQGSTKFCKAHGGGKRCMILGCNKGAEGSTPLCKGHGGGKRCMFEGSGICTKSVHGGTEFCVAHGGGKRCSMPDCSKSARGRTDFCVRHGGGKRCKSQGCGKSAQGSTDFCKAHGGGKRCIWGQEGSGYGPKVFKEGSEEFLNAGCDRFARGRLGLCAAHSTLVQDQRVHGLDHAASLFGPGLSAGLVRGLMSSSIQIGSNTRTPLSSEVALSANHSSPAVASSNEMSKRPNTMNVASMVMNEEGWSARVVDAPERLELGWGRKFVQSNIYGHLTLDQSVQCAELNLPGLGSSLPFTFQQAAAPGGFVSLGPSRSSSNAPENVAIQIAPPPSTLLAQSFPRSVIHPQALLPQHLKHTAISSPLKSIQIHASSTPYEVDSFGISSYFLPEGSVHGGGFLAFLTSEAAKKDKA